MEFAEAVLLREEGEIRLLKIGCGNNKVSFCVIGNNKEQVRQ